MSKNILTDKEQAVQVNIHTSKAAHERLKKRYKKERTFKTIGLMAILSAGLFLAFLPDKHFNRCLASFKPAFS